jgi:hypothetical protein
MDFHGFPRISMCLADLMADLRVSPALALGAGALALGGSGGIWAVISTWQSKEVRCDALWQEIMTMDEFLIHYLIHYHNNGRQGVLGGFPYDQIGSQGAKSFPTISGWWFQT